MRGNEKCREASLFRVDGVVKHVRVAIEKPHPPKTIDFHELPQKLGDAVA